MTPTALLTRYAGPAVAAAVALGLAGLPALAQGTAEQQEACTPDAVKFCSDTIPDIPKTTLCMKAHAAELTPRCRAVVDADDTPATAPRRRRAARAAPAPDQDASGQNGYGQDGYGPRQYEYLTPEGRAPAAEADPRDDRAAEDNERAREEIGRLCDDDMMDERSCAATQRALGAGR